VPAESPRVRLRLIIMNQPHALMRCQMSHDGLCPAYNCFPVKPKLASALVGMILTVGYDWQQRSRVA